MGDEGVVRRRTGFVFILRARGERLLPKLPDKMLIFIHIVTMFSHEQIYFRGNVSIKCIGIKNMFTSSPFIMRKQFGYMRK